MDEIFIKEENIINVNAPAQGYIVLNVNPFFDMAAA
jgi:hypothetical protein